MKNLQSLLPALIIALAVLGGLLSGAKIISNGVIEANRFQFRFYDEACLVFDTSSGGIYSFWQSSNSWNLWGGESYGSVSDHPYGKAEIIPAELPSVFHWHMFKKDKFWTK